MKICASHNSVYKIETKTYYVQDWSLGESTLSILLQKEKLDDVVTVGNGLNLRSLRYQIIIDLEVSLRYRSSYQI